jgi:hypothetical protein
MVLKLVPLLGMDLHMHIHKSSKQYYSYYSI